MTKSGVIGATPTRPRTPSVPKYFPAMISRLFFSIYFMNCSIVWSSTDGGLPDFECIDRFHNIMHTNDHRTLRRRCQGGTDTTGQTLLKRFAGNRADHRFARHAS